MSEESHPKTSNEALGELHDSIYREKVLRARASTMGQRCSDVFELSAFQLNLMLAGAMKRLDTTDSEVGWKEVRRNLNRLDRLQEQDHYTDILPEAS